MSAQGKPAGRGRRGPGPARTREPGLGSRPVVRAHLQGEARLQPLARRGGTPGRHADAREGVPEVSQVHLAREDRRRARHRRDDRQQSRHGRRHGEARDVHRGQHPRERDPGRRGVPLHDLVPDGALREARRDHAPGRRARVLHRAHHQSGRPRLLHAGPRRQRAHGPHAGRRRQRLPVRRRRPGGPERQRRHRADPQVRAGSGHAPEERRRRAPARARAARRDGRLRAPRPGGRGPRRRRPRGRGRPGELRSRTATTPPTGSPTTSRAGRWTTRSSCPRRRR